MMPAETGNPPGAATSIEKALEVCEALSLAPSGLPLTEVSRAVGLPRPSVHRLLAILKRRGYVRQDEDTQRYSLTLKMLDLSFRLLGRSELRLHAYPVLREYVLRGRPRGFVAVPASSEVTYIWGAGPDEAAMRTAYGKQMPAHCAEYFDGATQGSRRLSCLRLERAGDVGESAALVARLGSPSDDGGQRLFCTCAPVHDYTGREVARVGVFGHGPDDGPILTDHNREAWELGRRVSTRLGYLPTSGPDVH
ncbi:MAG TPA: helix-turn-helix domain-containing protein [Vicinamibacterales bacterium]|nr:helix-turn-helix domain-containing protein [Vicinamibacterales bacterium]